MLDAFEELSRRARVAKLQKVKAELNDLERKNRLEQWDQYWRESRAFTLDEFINLGRFLNEIGADFYVKQEVLIRDRIPLPPGDRWYNHTIAIRALFHTLQEACGGSKAGVGQMLEKIQKATDGFDWELSLSETKEQLYKWVFFEDEPASPHMTRTNLREMWKRAKQAVDVNREIESGSLLEQDVRAVDGSHGGQFGKSGRPSPKNKSRFLYADLTKQRRFLEILQGDTIFLNFS